ncbi:MAG TPA: tRNA uridine-5-carboxymethylaminomethyl(34) synthesis GTPase MnmE [Luteimonas sp.]|nr:tRNA uridine-5-carboxymethylaminomethyl(34) synthesis GTPase MnmE [Luteimonas sp.]
MDASADTIVAIATGAASAGIGIVRLSGPASHAIARTVAGIATPSRLPLRHARHVRLHDADGSVLDDGLVLLFAAPASPTGEDVAELQAHGSVPVLQALVSRCCGLGARRARAGEFSERAFVNGRLDLAQAEAVADLIAAGSLRGARAARRALDGAFSVRVDAIAAGLLALRVQVEASIDFVDEPIDPLQDGALAARLAELATAVDGLLARAGEGCRLRDGLHAVIVGPPNAGKSSLLNLLAGSERAIVSDTAGTTRDLLRETVRVDGVDLDLVDTAGLHAGGGGIEREGMRRARDELARADLAIVVVDARDPDAGQAAVAEAVAGVPRQLWLHNKIDLVRPQPPLRGAASAADGGPTDPLHVSMHTGQGLDAVRARLHALAAGDGGEGGFTARARHVEALCRVAADLADAGGRLRSAQPELAAEALRVAHDALGEITGRVAPDALLGHIFATFCIGK